MSRRSNVMARYVRVSNERVDKTWELFEGEVFADVDEQGNLVGVEIVKSPAPLPRIELLHAWMWNCEHCGAENFERCITKELDDLDIEVGLVPEYERHEYAVYGHPETVKCHECGSVYSPRAAGAEYDDDSQPPTE